MRISFTTSLLALTGALTAALPLALPLAPHVHAQANGPSQEGTLSMEAHLRAQLSAVEDGPLESEIRALGTEAAAALIAIASDDTALPVMRLRAITCLGWTSGSQPETYLRTLLRTEQEPMRLRAAIRAYGGLEGARAVSVIAAHGEHSDVAVREAVYLSLIAMLHSTQTATPAQQSQVRSALDRLLAREPDAQLAQRARSLRAAS